MLSFNSFLFASEYAKHLSKYLNHDVIINKLADEWIITIGKSDKKVFINSLTESPICAFCGKERNDYLPWANYVTYDIDGDMSYPSDFEDYDRGVICNCSIFLHNNLYFKLFNDKFSYREIKRYKWDEACDIIDNFKIGNFECWRFPSSDELKSITLPDVYKSAFWLSGHRRLLSDDKAIVRPTSECTAHLFGVHEPVFKHKNV